MESYTDFLNILQKKGSNPYSIGKCLGSRDAWKWVRKNKWKALKGQTIDALQYSAIINSVNKNIVNLILEGHEIEFPHQMGSLLLSSLPTRVAIEGNEIKTNYRTDWLKTLKLWYIDREARNSHKPIKRIQRNIYFIRYYKRKAKYHNMKFYRFRVNRSLRKILGHRIEKGRLAAECRDY